MNYFDFRRELEAIAEILQLSGLDQFILDQALEKRRQRSEDSKAFRRGLASFVQDTRNAFRIGILRAHEGCSSVRNLEIALADSPLEQWFCFVENFDQILALSKSSIDRAKSHLTPEILDQAFAMVLQKAACAPNQDNTVLEKALNLLGFKFPVDLLEKHRATKTDLSPGHANLIITRIDRVLGLLLQAIKQTHERIIDKRRVPNQEKILSIYETSKKVLVRGKSGAEVVYGNPLFFGENRDGLIVHRELFEDVSSDSKLLLGALLFFVLREKKIEKDVKISA